MFKNSFHFTFVLLKTGYRNGTLMRSQCVVIQERQELGVQGKEALEVFFLMCIFFVKRKVNKKEANIKID